MSIHNHYCSLDSLLLQVQGYSQHNYKQEMIDNCAVKVKRPELP